MVARGERGKFLSSTARRNRAERNPWNRRGKGKKAP